ncbi:NUDIX hydrolase [Staphylococcus pettenkoferi]|uniref:NUDIX hydrolase n=1 Tax=Staphylococcus pettenkoferi TaxID=170573 RepID=UPI00066CDBA7|nr:NUDIX domain-containing protein [Staphylococcus pettenkoferi]MCI2804490.1 NUDIX domain-containing protein [Staphylococcus pettenkoferi]MCY1628024.1 NUDIX domain-containing protein [Staphylococcus pettenkoferi]UIK47082.1 NUDIX domain-containing protein [Staphylococcus pettenkoferi]
MIKCVCLVVWKADKLLLVQSRNRQKYYFPGGKIDAGESQQEALVREIDEELGVHLKPDQLHYHSTVVGPAYPQKDMETELNCYTTSADIDWETLHPQSEITDLEWMAVDDTERIAPAMLKWLEHIDAIGEKR